MDIINHRNQHGRRKKPSIDGISGRPVSRFSQGSNLGSIHNTRRDSSIQASGSKSNQVANFKKTDGFNSSQQQITHNKSSQTYVIDRKQSKKPRFKKSKKQFNQSSKKPISKKKKVLRGIGIILIILSLIIGFLVFKGYITLNKILPGGGGAAALNENVDPSLLNGEGDGRVNILLLGRGGELQDSGPDLTDTIILASIDPVAKEAALLSVPRDLYVEAGDTGSSMKINAVFFTGKQNYLSEQTTESDQITRQAEEAGLDMLDKTVENVLGVPIHYHIMIDFKGFEDAVNNVGGITINAPEAVSEQMRIYGQPYYLDVQPGVQDMDGFEALAYSRSRMTSPKGDFARAERQRIIITALKDKILSAGTFTNPQKISNLLNTFGNRLQTNFNVNDLQRLYEITGQIGGDKITSLDLVSEPNVLVVSGNVPGAGSIQVPRAGIGNFKEIQSFVRNTLKDSFIKDENASILVLNGTETPGLATDKGEELKSFGYTVTKVDNAPARNYEKTIIVDLRNGDKKYTKNYLEKRFGVLAVGNLPDPAILPESADFVIILGSDQAVE